MNKWLEDWFLRQVAGEGHGGGAEPEPELAPEPVVGEGDPDSELTPEPEPAPEPEPMKAPAVHRRISELTEAKRRSDQAVAQERAKNAVLEEKVRELVAGGDPEKAKDLILESEVEKRLEARTAQKSFNDTCDAIITKGSEKHQDFAFSIATMNTNIGMIPDSMILAADATGHGADVLYALSKDLDMASEIRAMSPAQQGVALARYADKITKVPTRQASAAPAPITPKVNTTRAAPGKSLDSNDLPTDEWMRLREKQIADKRDSLRRRA